MTTTDFDSVYKLPIFERQADILAAVDANQVTIITAETGAGKSTQVPQYLAEHGYKKIIVTQPRILASRNLSMRVRQEYSWRLGKDATDLVGYRTAHERDDNPDNVILYCTDGLQLVRELTGSGTRERQILILDEIHEWNENMEVLIAWAKKRCQEDPAFKVVLMSATIEADSLAAYFNTPALISVAGRTYPVEKQSGTDLINDILQVLDKQTSNMLVFLPGKAEIEAVAEAVRAQTPKEIPIIPLHSQLEPEAQQLAFASYPRGKVVLATNVAQTSVTIDDIDVVVDSGLERRAEVRSGVEGLFIEEVSQADCLQRAGRAGRTKEGLYILAPLGTMPCTPLEQRPAYGVPEILRKHLDRLVLRLSAIGIDIEDLEFYHSPTRKTIKQAKRTLVSLGAVTPDGRITAIGQKMERFPVESSYARMLVEAEQYSEVVQSKLATIIAIQEVGGIVKGGPRYTGWRRFTQQTRSDLLAQYDVYLALDTLDSSEFEDLGIIEKNVTKAREVNERLNHDLGLGEAVLEPVQESETDELLRSIVAGQMHQIWLAEPTGEAMHIATKKVRELSSGTVVKHANLLVGTAFDLQVPTSSGLETLHLVNDLTAVNPQWLEELAPGLFKVRPGTIYYDNRYGTLVARTLVKYGGRTFEANGMPILEHTPNNEKLFITLYSAWIRERLEKERQTLQLINSRRIPQVPLRRIEDHVRDVVQGAVSLHELDRQQRFELDRIAKLDAHLDPHFMAGLVTTPSHSKQNPRFHRRPQEPHHKRKHDRWRNRDR